MKNSDNISPDIEELFHSPYSRQHISQLLKKHSVMEEIQLSPVLPSTNT